MKIELFRLKIINESEIVVFNDTIDSDTFFLWLLILTKIVGRLKNVPWNHFNYILLYHYFNQPCTIACLITKMGMTPLIKVKINTKQRKKWISNNISSHLQQTVTFNDKNGLTDKGKWTRTKKKVLKVYKERFL